MRIAQATAARRILRDYAHIRYVQGRPPQRFYYIANLHGLLRALAIDMLSL